MTIVVGVAAPDGLILAADSRTTMWPDPPADDGRLPRHRTVSDSAQKLFQLSDCCAAATYGDAFVGSRTINGLMDEFIAQQDGLSDVKLAAEALGGFFHGQVVDALADAGAPWDADATDEYRVGFIVAGYDDRGVGHMIDVMVPRPTVQAVLNTQDGGAIWRGQASAIERLIFSRSAEDFARLDTEPTDEVVQLLGRLEVVPLFPITLQDAVDYGVFLIRTTIDFQRFTDGIVGAPGAPPGCGGPVRVLAITRDDVEHVNPASLDAGRAPGSAEGPLAS